MTELVVVLSTGKGTWAHISELLKTEFEKVFFITNDFGKEKFNAPPNAEFVVLDRNLDPIDMKEQIVEALKGKIAGTEVAFNFISGTGAEHMAALSALLSLGVGVRLVVAGKAGMEEL